MTTKPEQIRPHALQNQNPADVAAGVVENAASDTPLASSLLESAARIHTAVHFVRDHFDEELPFSRQAVSDFPDQARRFETAAKAICRQEAEALHGGSRKARERVEQYIDNNWEERRAKVVRQYECFLARQSDREQRGPDQALCGALANMAGRTCGWSSHVVPLENERRQTSNG